MKRKIIGILIKATIALVLLDVISSFIIKIRNISEWNRFKTKIEILIKEVDLLSAEVLKIKENR